MSGHSKWKTIKHQKESTDKKRGALFSKLLKAVVVAAKDAPNPQFNPRLRTAVEKAKQGNVPGDNIERAIQRASEKGENLEELVIEAYGPGGAAIFVSAITDNSNRTIPELKKLLSDYGGKWAEQGSVYWAFEQTTDGWKAKFPQTLDPEDAARFAELVAALEEHEDVERVYTNAT